MSTMLQDGAQIQAKQPGFGGGVNIRDVPSALEEDEAIALANIILDERGGVSKRQGSTLISTVGTGTDRILSIYTWYRVASDPHVIIHLSDGSLRYSTNYDTGSPSWTTIATGKSTSAPYNFETYLDRLYMSNGVNNYAKWDGTTFTEMASNPKGKYLKLWKDSMWVSGVEGSGLENRIYSSNVGDPDTFGASSFVDIFKGDGDRIKALGADANALIPFKQRRFFIIFDPVTFANRLMDSEKGCESHRSLLYSEEGIYFLSSVGICVYFGDGPAEMISGKIQPLFTASQLNYTALDLACSYQDGVRFGWSLPEASSAVPNLQIEYYPRYDKKPWTFHRLPARAMASVRKQTNVLLLYGHNASNKVEKAFVGSTDDGTAFQALVEVGWYDFNSPLNWKYLNRVKLVGRGKFEIQFKRNFETAIKRNRLIDFSGGTDLWTTADTWNVGEWGPESNIREIDIYPDVYGRVFLVRLLDAESGVGIRPIDIGGRQASITEGEWTLLEMAFAAQVIGDMR